MAQIPAGASNSSSNEKNTTRPWRSIRRLALGAAVAASGHRPHRLPSGAGHDAAVMAGLAPMAMLFVRSPGGVSHRPDEAVRPEDVRAALDVMVAFLHRLAGGAA